MAQTVFHKLWQRTTAVTMCAAVLIALSVPRTALAKACPNLVILIDQSASMAQNSLGQSVPQGSPDSKWSIATKALTNMNNKYDGLLPLGYCNFPNPTGCSVNAKIPIPPGYSNRIAINNAMITYPFSGGNTPTCTAVTSAAADLVKSDPTRPGYLLLVTDGSPDALCCGADPVKTTVDAIRAAANPTVAGTPPVYTMVLGFGKTLDSERASLNLMADAGGFPLTQDPTYHYYRAEDATALEQALATIVKSVVGGDAGTIATCEDGCYAKGCPGGQVCYQNSCRANPCATKTCPSSQYCLPTFYANGTSNAECVDACRSPCPQTSRCDRGKCVGDPCSGQCLPGQKCQPIPDSSFGTCVDEPLCKNTICHQGQGCFAGATDGQCVDNLCNYVTCPQGTVCHPFTGACESPDPQPVLSLGAGGIGCDVSQTASSASRLSWLSSGLLLSLLLLSRRRGAGRA
ncbi:MAG TPA: vWA domain-containing protein [Pseudomonadota bacterium]|jgi:hypothetical protein|nr:vWA domain-containing protein [Pseudomonadota bacterium]HNK44548.1 vWA domain-containing protein [Pseudomonadota bacterium]HNN52858.1 vWA domain-containing protein [Pseudomonadota bacterium]HNO68439.1 vWA domain-containing protein [Pseudomonadota bacterium]